MPHNQTILDFISRHAGTIGLMLLSVVAVIGRAFYIGAPWRQVIGDLILCPVFVLVFIPVIPESITIAKHEIPISPEMAATVIGVLGIHGLRYIVTLKNRRDEINLKPKDQING
ncbi:hypothetical protein [Enterobacter roggenkampii]|uniref:hypothetical protein n=1 Tax=Enterobacter roggenkampii TaxID=1812935 RepID=UPI001F36EE23|nr:hypothetical protein [Enterobacter roggenkampii]